MSGQKFGEEEIQHLNGLPCIEKATDKLLIFKQSFKREAENDFLKKLQALEQGAKLEDLL